jgi:hypothetical protein
VRSRVELRGVQTHRITQTVSKGFHGLSSNVRVLEVVLHGSVLQQISNRLGVLLLQLIQNVKHLTNKTRALALKTLASASWAEILARPTRNQQHRQVWRQAQLTHDITAQLTHILGYVEHTRERFGGEL